MDTSSELIKILVPAVGGQGGGVLTEWLVQAFQLDGYQCQAIGLPGLSQRGGSTTYYLEAHPEPDKRVMFSQYPMPGDVDIILAQEFLELGRVLEQGYGSEKTTIVSSTHRIYSALEKMPISSGIYSEANLEKIADRFSKEFIGLNALEMAKDIGLDEMGINAILLGALAATGVLPVNEASFLKAIEGLGIAVANNIKGFRTGWDAVQSNRQIQGASTQGDWRGFVEDRKKMLGGKRAESFTELLSDTLSSYPIHLKEILAEALFRLIEYQGPRYARKYLNRLDKIHEIDSAHEEGFRLTGQFAKSLALLFTYEDGIRVAELKIKPERFAQIRKDFRISNDQVYRVIDYLKPDFYEIYGLMPAFIVAPILKLTSTSLWRFFWRRKHPLTFAQKPVTNSFGGFFRLWALTKFKFTRTWSYRYHREHKLIKTYVNAVEKYSEMDYELGCMVARAGSVVKGYGKVRRRTMSDFATFLNDIVAPLAELESEAGEGFNITLDIGERTLGLLASDSSEGIEEAIALARAVLDGSGASPSLAGQSPENQSRMPER